jgi:VIT1/CCC1 family predicted Fe2+/Mn2+ transporter
VSACARPTTSMVTEGNQKYNQTSQVETRDSKRVLEPMETISEVWFGLLMVLTFTCSLSVNGAGREEVRTLLIGALGCNLAWGIIDGVMYLVRRFAERGIAIAKLRAVQHAPSPNAAYGVISDSLPPLLVSVLSPADLETMRQKLSQLPAPSALSLVTKKDWLGALAVFLAVFLTTFPVAIPFLFINNVRFAIRMSNSIAVVVLFLTGYAFGVYTDQRPWKMGIWMAIIGGALVAVAVALGG